MDSTGNTLIGKVSRPPVGMESWGSRLFKTLDSKGLLGFIAFLDFEPDFFLYPALDPEQEAPLAEELRGSEWKTLPEEKFVEAFKKAGVPVGPVGTWVHWNLITLKKGDAPAGAYAFVNPTSRQLSLAQPSRLSLDALFTEMARDRRDLRCLREGVAERDYLLSLFNRSSCLLMDRAEGTVAYTVLLELAIHVAQAEVGILLIQRDGKLVPEVEMGLPPDVIRGLRFFPEGDSLIDRVASTRQAAVIDDVSGPSIHVPRPFEVRITGLVCVPLFSGERLIGLMGIATGEEGQDWAPNFLESLEAVSGILKLAIENEMLRSTAGRPEVAALKAQRSSDSRVPTGAVDVVAFELQELRRLGLEIENNLCKLRLGTDLLAQPDSTPETPGAPRRAAIQGAVDGAFAGLGRIGADLLALQDRERHAPQAFSLAGALLDSLEASRRASPDPAGFPEALCDVLGPEAPVFGNPAAIRHALMRICSEVASICDRDAGLALRLLEEDGKGMAFIEFDSRVLADASLEDGNPLESAAAEMFLGVAAAKRIVERQEGALDFLNLNGARWLVRVSLPAAPSAAPEAAP